MKTYTVNRIEESTLNINGLGNSTPWKTAELLTDFIAPWDLEFKPKVAFKALWDVNNFYFCFHVEDQEVYLNTTDDSIESIGSSDRVELFFRKDKDLNPYYCLEMDSSARLMDFKAKAGKVFDFDWNWSKHGIELKSNVNANGYTLEGVVSISVLKELKLLYNSQLEVGIFAAKFKLTNETQRHPIWMSWVHPQVTEPNFHQPLTFGSLILKG
ncbi:putative carbohydrate binding module (CBM9) [Formosa agariphila KMM 3901]|uniref:Putative carbohydrate binding module (CBM9) n=1 Tax=Formosa agariphila (strain DSM 15362 / KCTC 12365 / LMG 23005 / KMM 3901 / M-2Alg 35-1) TaxID=1347342 RepID=T2KPD8_FORAG|nr:carbohydrate-binding family 9-like protein [Formosa agariphila]CDF80338.1 putative carbohydrate binding module (CBM9) [Formosa agariphila KMM 3901]